MRHRAVPTRDKVPDRCHPSGSAMDVYSDAPAWAPQAERAADGGVVDVAEPFSVLSSAPRLNAERVTRFAPYNTHNCLPPQKLRPEIQ